MKAVLLMICFVQEAHNFLLPEKDDGQHLFRGRKLPANCAGATWTAKDYTLSANYASMAYWQGSGTNNVKTTILTSIDDFILGANMAGKCKFDAPNGKVYTATSTTCSGTVSTAITATLSGNTNVVLNTNTATPFASSYFCLGVPDSDGPLHYSLPFAVSVQSCSSQITFTDVS